MTVISTTARQDDQPARVAYRSIWKLLIFLLVVGFAFWRVSDLKQIEMVSGNRFYTMVADFLLGAVLGATMSHFVVDAGAWKLSMARQRDYITKRFNFIFDKGTRA